MSVRNKPAKNTQKKSGNGDTEPQELSSGPKSEVLLLVTP